MLRVSILISTYQYSVLSSFGSIFYYNRMCISMHRVSILISTYQYSVFPSFCSIFYYNRMCLSMHRVSLISTQFSHHFVRFLLQQNLSLNAPRESYQYSVFPSFCSIFYYNRMCISMHRVSILISIYKYSVYSIILFDVLLQQKQLPRINNKVMKRKQYDHYCLLSHTVI